MFKKILLPLDSSRLAEYALKPALWLAEQSKGEIILLHVLEPEEMALPEVVAYGMAADVSRERGYTAAQAYLNELRNGLGRTRAGLAWRTRMEEGDPASEIVDVAATEGVDLIVMSTHGYSGITRWVMGSVTEKVLRAAPCPVLTVRSPLHVQKMLITLDGSHLSEQGLAPGFALARAFDAEVTLLTVDSLLDTVDAREAAAIDRIEHGLGQRLIESYYHRMDDYLEDVAMRYGKTGVRVDTAVLQGNPAAAILDYAERKQIDLIVMATHGRTGLRRWVYGSVTEKVMRGTKSAMLIIRPARDEFVD